MKTMSYAMFEDKDLEDEFPEYYPEDHQEETIPHVRKVIIPHDYTDIGGECE